VNRKASDDLFEDRTVVFKCPEHYLRYDWAVYIKPWTCKSCDRLYFIAAFEFPDRQPSAPLGGPSR
jgi:hypothetical protein